MTEERDAGIRERPLNDAGLGVDRDLPDPAGGSSGLGVDSVHVTADSAVLLAFLDTHEFVGDTDIDEARAALDRVGKREGLLIDMALALEAEREQPGYLTDFHDELCSAEDPEPCGACELLARFAELDRRAAQ